MADRNMDLNVTETGYVDATMAKRSTHSANIDAIEYSTPIYYLHRAKIIATGLYTMWRHTSYDPTGSASGYPPGSLTDIVNLGVI